VAPIGVEFCIATDGHVSLDERSSEVGGREDDDEALLPPFLDDQIGVGSLDPGDGGLD
jgi:hypothetical protein